MSSFSVASSGQDLGLKLSESERMLVARLLSDPTYFPIEFRTWLKNYIESAGIKVTASQISSGTRTRTGLPAGLFISCGSVGAVPPDALPCDGAAVSRTIYAALFSKIHTTWGVGDGSTTFNVPDMRDRSPFGAGVTVTPGATDGQAAGIRKGPTHHHGTHVHSLSPNPQGFNPTAASGSSGSTSGDRSLQQAVTSPAQVGPPASLQDAPNWAGVVYAITTGQTA